MMSRLKDSSRYTVEVEYTFPLVDGKEFHPSEQFLSRYLSVTVKFTASPDSQSVL